MPPMEWLCRTHPRPLQLPLSSRRPATFKPFISLLKPFSPQPPLLSLRASSSKPPASPLPSLLKSVSIASAASAALFLARLRNPALAATPLPPSPAQQERVLEEQPGDFKSLRALMELKVKEQKLAEAVRIVDRMITLEPRDVDLQLLKAHLQSYNGEGETAKKGFEQLLEKDPFLVEAYHGLVMAASQSEDDGDLDNILRRIEDAMELCKKADRKESLRDFRLLVAQIRVIEGKYDDSLKIYQELVKEEPRDFRPYLCQGIVYTLLKKKDEAEKQFQKYRGLVPKGHPYAQYFDDNMFAMKAFGPMEENKTKAPLKS